MRSQKAILTKEQDELLKRLLERNDDLFVTDNVSIGIVPFIKHVIDTGQEHPIRSKPYRVSVNEQKVIRQLVNEMLDEGVIRTSRSHWASPIVLVKKKGSSDLRFRADHRKLNKITRVDPYPIPNMNGTERPYSASQ